MPGIITGHREGGLPIIDCILKSPASDRETQLRALVDTGATHCVTTPQVIASVGLPVAGVINNTVTGRGALEVPTYRAEVLLRGRQVANLDAAFTFTTTDVTLLSENLSGFDMILGWQVLFGMNATFDRNGSFALIFG